MIRVRIQEEVFDYLRRLAPEARHALRMAIKGLCLEEGDIRPLADELEGFHRLRVGTHRVVFEYETVRGARLITCVFAGSRNWVYAVFQSRLRQ